MIKLLILTCVITIGILLYTTIGVLFAYIINKFYAKLTGETALACWPLLLVLLAITLASACLKKIFDKLHIPNDIYIDFFRDPR